MSVKPLDEEDLFKVACQIVSPQGRADYLRQVCGDDSTLHDRALAATHYLVSPRPVAGVFILQQTATRIRELLFYCPRWFLGSACVAPNKPEYS